MFEVGVKRKYWFGYKKFKAVKCFIQGYATLYNGAGVSFEGPIDPILVIVFSNGTEHYIGDIEKRDWYSKEVK